MTRPLVAFLALVLTAACGDASGEAGTAGIAAASPASDGGTSPTLDAGSPSPTPDAATPLDLPNGPLAPALPCDDPADAIYTTPDLPPHEAALRGEIIACTTDASITIENAQSRMDGANVIGVTASSGVRVFRVSYRTEREPGEGALGTAVVMLPDAPRDGMLPAIVAAHGTAGLADMCAPSRIPFVGDDLILPWAASGLPVIAPDYAGLGNEGVQGYGHQADTSHSVLDAARALRALLGNDPRLSNEAILAGHSQGGGAVQAAQAFAPSYLAPDFEVPRVVSFAGALPAQNTSLGLGFPLVPIAGAAGVTRAVVVLNLYATFHKLFGADRAADVFDPTLRPTINDAIENQCIYQLTTTLATPTADYTVPLTLGAVLDPTFEQEALDCIGGGACSDRFVTYRDYVADNVIPLEDSTARVLLLSGGMDAQQPPESQGCTRTALDAAGIETDVCQYPSSTHFDIVPSSIGHAIAWALDPSSPCPETAMLPICAP